MVLMLTATVSVHGQTQQESRIAGFISATAGNFSLKFPTVQFMGESYGFDKVYGSKNGLFYGGEAGIGLGDIGLFGVVKYRLWKKSGNPVEIGAIDFDGDVTWSQTFLSVGGRYYLVTQTATNRSFLPFFGGGIIQSTAKEEMRGEASYYSETAYVDVSAEVDGTGFYLEGGAAFFVAPSIAFGGFLEYSWINLGISAEGARAEIEGGGGLFAGVSLSAFFGRPMKSLN